MTSGCKGVIRIVKVKFEASVLILYVKFTVRTRTLWNSKTTLKQCLLLVDVSTK